MNPDTEFIAHRKKAYLSFQKDRILYKKKSAIGPLEKDMARSFGISFELDLVIVLFF